MSYKWKTLLAVAISSFMSSLDSSIVNISLPRLTDVFQTDISVVVWVNIVYLLISTSLILFIGNIGDIFGRKKLFIIGFIFFIAGLSICSLSPNIFVLILGRTVQGIGGAIIAAMGMAIVTDAFPSNERGKAVGMLASIISAGVLSGPVLGGILLDTLGWQSIFYIRIPIAMAGLIMSWLFLKKTTGQKVRTQLDLPGAALIFTSLSCLLLFLNLGEDWGFASLPSLALIISAIVLIGLFILQERRHSNPILDLQMFKVWGFASGNLIRLIVTLSTVSYTHLTLPTKRIV